jgi:hypothetical protein
MYKTVSADVEEIELEGENGNDVPGVLVTCSRCGHQTESYGTDEPSILRGCAVLNEECPRGERNFYPVEA